MTQPAPGTVRRHGYYHVRVGNLWTVGHWGLSGWSVVGHADVFPDSDIAEVGAAVPPLSATITPDKILRASHLLSKISEVDKMLRVSEAEVRLAADFGFRTLTLPSSLRREIAPALRAHLRQMRAEHVADLLALLTPAEEVPPR